MTKKHLQFVASLPCCGCGSGKDIQAHHILKVPREYLDKPDLPFGKVKSKGMGTKSDDKFTIPLCFKCHRELHDLGSEDAFFASREEPIKLALYLFSHAKQRAVCFNEVNSFRMNELFLRKVGYVQSSGV